MRGVVVLALSVLVACTKPNPNRCCTTEADCNAQGIPVGQMCQQGLVCRGNECVAETCSTFAECDPATPYCVMQLCAESCTDDSQCPGNGRDASQVHCVAGSCVECRSGGSDCPATAPVCDAGSCRACTAHADCPSDVCNLDTGICVPTAAVTYAAPGGSTTSSCTQTDPCTLARALGVADPSRPAVRLANGSYEAEGDLVFTGVFGITVWGPGTVRTLNISSGSSLAIRDVTASYGFNCVHPSLLVPQPTLDLQRVTVTGTADQASNAVSTSGACKVNVKQSKLTAQLAPNISISGDPGGAGSVVTLDQTEITGGDPAILLQNTSVITVTNSLVHGQGNQGVYNKTTLQEANSGTFSFSTFYNTVLKCPTGNVTIAFSNNIFLNEASGAPSDTVTGTSCSHAYDLIKPQATAVGSTNILNMDPRFVNGASGDFHLVAGSPAIDAADPTATDAVDYEGTARPQGARRDIGAFEYH